MKVHPLRYAIIDDDSSLVQVQSEFIRLLGHLAHGFIIGVRDESDNLSSVAEKIARLNPHVIVIDYDFFCSDRINGTKLLQRLERDYWSKKKMREPLILASSGKPGHELSERATAVFSHKYDLLKRDNTLLSWHMFAELIHLLSCKVRVRSSFVPEFETQAA